MKTKIIISKKSIPFRTIQNIPIKRKLTQSEQIIEYLKTHKSASVYQLSGVIKLSSHGAEHLRHLETNGIIKGRVCECGKDKLYSLANNLK